jgi:hypothetical protein
MLIIRPSQDILGVLILTKKMMCNKNNSWLFFVARGYIPIFGMENQWLKCLIMHQNPQVVFFNRMRMVQHAILSLMAKTTDHYVMLVLDSCVITPISF